MKKSIIVNICGIVFHIDEDAYEELNNYIAELNNYFSSQPSGKEIVNDIETRIVELLQPKLSDNKQSITIEDIHEIISILGKPKDIADSDEGSTNNQRTEKNNLNEDQGSRRLYRNPEDAVIGGVSAGMGAYFNIDPLIFRIIFFALIFAGGIGLLIYIVLWISVPQAKTVSQRLEMKGKNINISNIEKKIKEEYELVKNNLSNINRNPTTNKLAGFINHLLVAFGKFILIVASILKYIFAVLFIGFALTLIIAAIVALFSSNYAINNGFVSNLGSVKDYFNCFILPIHTDFLLFCGLAIIILPCIGLIYWGLKILIHFQARDKWVSITMSLAWILSIIVFVTILLTEVTRYKTEYSNHEMISLKVPSNNRLYLKLINNENIINGYFDDDLQPLLFGVKKSNTKCEMYSQINLRIRKADGDKPELEIVRWANSSDYFSASDATKKIKINFNQNDTILSIDPLFRLEDSQKWNFQRCKVILNIPENFDIKVDDRFFDFSYRHSHYSYENELNLNCIWKATDIGLEVKN
jgi:phage shock protein PspC (stress-responsive transcriptional regulator)